MNWNPNWGKNFSSKERGKYLCNFFMRFIAKTLDRDENKLSILDPVIFKKLETLNQNYFEKYHLLFTFWHKHEIYFRNKYIFVKLRLVKEKYLSHNLINY